MAHLQNGFGLLLPNIVTTPSPPPPPVSDDAVVVSCCGIHDVYVTDWMQETAWDWQSCGGWTYYYYCCYYCCYYNCGCGWVKFWWRADQSTNRASSRSNLPVCFLRRGDCMVFLPAFLLVRLLAGWWKRRVELFVVFVGSKNWIGTSQFDL